MIVPRLPGKDEDLRGKVCVCSVGRPFIVTGEDWLFPGTTKALMGWCGMGLDGKGTAFSSSPVVISESGQEFYEKLRDRFGGKMSFNG